MQSTKQVCNRLPGTSLLSTKAIKWQQFHKQVRKGEVSLIGFDFVFRRNVHYAEVLANSAKCLWNLGAELCPDLLEEHLWGGYVTLAPCGTVMRALFSVLSLRAAPRSFFSEQFTKWAVLFLRAGRLTVFMRITFTKEFKGCKRTLNTGSGP